MAGPKPMRTEFGIRQRLESCVRFKLLLLHGEGKFKRSSTLKPWPLAVVMGGIKVVVVGKSYEQVTLVCPKGKCLYLSERLAYKLVDRLLNFW